jgi:acyl-CoA synthetase (AMP-forming)/AMP-acid ligase II
MFQTTEDLIPNRIRRLSAREQPLATVVKVDGAGAGESQSFTLRDLDNLSNKAAWFLDKNIQEEKFLYMGPSDIRYLIWVLAAMKTRKCVSNYLDTI